MAEEQAHASTSKAATKAGPPSAAVGAPTLRAAPADAAALDELNGGAHPMDMPAFDIDQLENEGSELSNSIEMLGDVDLHVVVELGRTEMLVEDVLQLAEGSVVELDKLAGDPVDVYVNQRLVARGEVLVLNDNFCIRISEILADLEEHAAAAAEQELGPG